MKQEIKSSKRKMIKKNQENLSTFQEKALRTNIYQELW